MTDYDAMTDEELAVLVAEKVMGWRPQMSEQGGVLFWRDAATGAITYQWVFDPLHDWGAAGLVIERIANLGWCVAIEIEMASPRAFVELYRPESVLRDRGAGRVERATECGTAHADTAPRAICIAALCALDSEART